MGSDLINADRLGRCPDCGDAVHRNDERWEITREGDDHPPMGTSVHYHAGCAPFGATSIPDEIEREQARKQAGEAMRRDLAEGFDAE